jgi:transcriptional regulator with XRE-family HTH domain
MPGNGPTIYQMARKTSDYTQEQVAEALKTSEATVKAWEQGARVPSDETVAAMATLYGTPWLELEHLRATSEPLGVLPEMQLQSLPTAVIHLINLILDFSDHHRDRALMQIAEDGVIDEDERPEFDSIAADLSEIIAAAYQVLYAPPDKKRTPRGGNLEAFRSTTCVANQPANSIPDSAKRRKP